MPSARPSLLLWATALLAVVGSAAAVHAAPPFAGASAAAAAAADAALLRARTAPRFAPALGKQIELTERSPGPAAGGPGRPGQPDLAATPLLMPRAVTNLQLFRGALANLAAPAITQSNDVTRPFAVNGDTFNDYQSAVDRSCDNQHNSCAKAANSQKSAGFTVGDCDTQDTQCKAAALSATQTAFTQLASSTSEFDIYCDI